MGRHGKFNFLLSNGECIFTYMNGRETLHYLLRHPPHKGFIKLKDEDFEVRLEELKAPDEYAAIGATNPLTDEEWNRMNPPNMLYVYYNDDLLLIVKKGEPKLVLDKLEHEVLKTIRSAPHSVILEDLARELGLTPGEASRVMVRPRNKVLIGQHSRDDVPPDHPRARYYTNPRLRVLIDKTLSL